LITLLQLIAVLFSPSVRAADISWRRPEGGTFSSAGSWFGGVVPGVADTAHFGLSTTLFSLTEYTVSFSANATNSALKVEDDFVLFDLNGHSYTTGGTNMEIGNVVGKIGQLTLTDGTWNLNINTSIIEIGAVTGASGSLVVSTGGQIGGLAPLVHVGDDGGGTLVVQNGGDISATATRVGWTGAGAATITGTGSTLINSDDLDVGFFANGAMTISTGGVVQNLDGRVGSGSATGTVTVTNASSRWTNLGELYVSSVGPSQLIISNIARVENTNGYLGFFDGHQGTATIGDDFQSAFLSRWINSGTLTVGHGGNATLTIKANGLVQNTNGTMAVDVASTSQVTLESPNAQWINSGDLIVGKRGDATLTVTAGTVQSVRGTIGDEASSSGAVVIDGPDSQWISTGVFTVGSLSRDATLEITNGGSVTCATGTIGNTPGSLGTATVDGAGSTWTTSGNFEVGNGTLTISNGAVVTMNGPFGTLADLATSDAEVNVVGQGSRWDLAGALLTVGDDGQAALNITNGGNVFSRDAVVGADATSTGTVVVSGAGSQLYSGFPIIIGDSGSGTLSISSGGFVSSGPLIATTETTIGNGAGSSGIVLVDGVGSTWLLDNSDLIVGSFGSGLLNITGGGVVSNVEGKIGLEPGPTSQVNVTGAGSAWNNSHDLAVGDGGTGVLNITDGGSVSSANTEIAQETGSAGAATVVGAGSKWTIHGRLGVGGVAGDLSPGGSGTLNINPGATVQVEQNTVIFPSSIVRLQGGTFDTTAISFHPGGGQFEWSSGTLHTGTFNGDLLNQGGTLAPGHSAGTTTITGSYTQQSGGKLEIEIGGTTAGSAYDVVNVTSSASLNGQLQLALLNGFAPGASDTFTVLTATGGIFGTFSNAANGARLDTIDDLGSFQVNYVAGGGINPTRVVLNNFVPNVLPGDFNDDGVVNAADFVVWRKFNLAPAAYNTWRSHFGQTNGSSSSATANAAVPEPASLCLLVTSFLAASSLHRRLRRQD
jgi:T5SS/PEP-CTERM-associated repeat protein